MDYSTILYETDGGKARITLNRPDKLNAISWQMQQELRDALWAADRDPHVHVAILRGAGRAYVDVPRRPAVGEAHASHRRHDLGEGSGARWVRAEGSPVRGAGGGGRRAGGQDGADRRRLAGGE